MSVAVALILALAVLGVVCALLARRRRGGVDVAAVVEEAFAYVDLRSQASGFASGPRDR